MKKLVVLLMVLFVATSAFAQIDPNTNSMGLYFDEGAEFPCVDDATPYSTIPVYLALTRPDFANLYGFEAGFTMEGPAQVLQITFTNPQPLNVGSNGDMIVGFGSPTATADVTVLAIISVLYMSTANEPVNFTLHGTTPSSIDPAFPVLLLEGGELLSSGLSAAEGYTAQINGGCTVVATEEMTFDNVKSLYR